MLVPLVRRQALDLSNVHFHPDAERLIRAIEKAEAPVQAAVAADITVEENGLGARVRNLDLEPVRNTELLLVGLDRYVDRLGDFTRNPFDAAKLCSDALIPGDDAGKVCSLAAYHRNGSLLFKDAGVWRLQLAVQVEGVEAIRREFFVRWAPGEEARLVGDPRKEPRNVPRPPEVPKPMKQIPEPRLNRMTIIAIAVGLAAVLGLYAVIPKRPSSEPPAKPAAASAASSAKEPFVHSVDGLTYVWIEPGEFSMGCSPGDTACSDDEKPAHPVEITHGFWIGQTEVTQAAWREVMKTEPGRFKGDELPVESIAWDEARDYCSKIVGRLPSEAEWEFSARAQSTSARYGDFDRGAWFSGNSDSQTKPVKGKRPNAWGLYDMLGNVWEWTADWYNGQYYQQKKAKEPTGPSSGHSRVVRRGCWSNGPRSVRSSYRYGALATGRNYFVGFRCAGEFR